MRAASSISSRRRIDFRSWALISLVAIRKIHRRKSSTVVPEKSPSPLATFRNTSAATSSATARTSKRRAQYANIAG